MTLIFAAVAFIAAATTIGLSAQRWPDVKTAAVLAGAVVLVQLAYLATK